MNDKDYGNVKVVFDKRGGNRYNLVISDAKLVYRTNFSGEEKTFNGSVINESGMRNFNVAISNPELADWLRDEGWNVKTTRGSDDYEPESYIPVKVSFGKYPPVIKRHAGRNVVALDEYTVGQLDRDRIICADLVINPSHWSSFNGSGIAAYLRSAHFTVEDDPFAYKYEEEPVDDTEDLPF